MVRIVLIALLASCYKPSIADCVDTCGESKLCPEGFSCVGGFCTTGTACTADAPSLIDTMISDALHDAGFDAMLDAFMPDAGVDASPIDAMVDATPIDAMVDASMIDAMPDAMVDAMLDAMVDAPPDAAPDAFVPDAFVPDAAVDAMVDAAMCPPPPTASSCQTITPPPMYPACFTVCTGNVTNMVANTFSSNGWHVAIIKSDMEEQAAKQALAGSGVTEAWIGLLQGDMTNHPTMVDGMWHWVQETTNLTYSDWGSGQPDDGDHTENDAEDCGTLKSDGWYDEPCMGMRPFLIEPD